MDSRLNRELPDDAAVRLKNFIRENLNDNVYSDHRAPNTVSNAHLLSADKRTYSLPVPLTESNVTAHERIWDSIDGGSDASPTSRLGLSPPLQSLQDRVIRSQGFFYNFSDSENESSSQDTMIMTTTEESLRVQRSIARNARDVINHRSESELDTLRNIPSSGPLNQQENIATNVRFIGDFNTGYNYNDKHDNAKDSNQTAHPWFRVDVKQTDECESGDVLDELPQASCSIKPDHHSNVSIPHKHDKNLNHNKLYPVHYNTLDVKKAGDDDDGYGSTDNLSSATSSSATSSACSGHSGGKINKEVRFNTDNSLPQNRLINLHSLKSDNAFSAKKKLISPGFSHSGAKQERNKVQNVSSVQTKLNELCLFENSWSISEEPPMRSTEDHLCDTDKGDWSRSSQSGNLAVKTSDNKAEKTKPLDRRTKTEKPVQKIQIGHYSVREGKMLFNPDPEVIPDYNKEDTTEQRINQRQYSNQANQITDVQPMHMKVLRHPVKGNHSMNNVSRPKTPTNSSRSSSSMDYDRSYDSGFNTSSKPPLGSSTAKKKKVPTATLR